VAGGEITWLAVVVTAILAMPLCVLLAGRIASLWRLAIAVGGAQFLYHWAFAGLGTGSPLDGTPAPLHAAHMAALQSFTPTASPMAAGAAMWLWHAAAAAVTVALVYRGERAALALLHLVRRAVRIPTAGASAALPRIVHERIAIVPVDRLSDRLLSAAAITHRGPPVAA